MAYELRDGQGSIFKNKKKTTDRHPDYTGRCMIGGQTYYLSAWIKGGQEGRDKFLSLAFTEPRDQQDTEDPPF